MMKSEFLATMHEHGISPGIFGTAAAPAIIQVPYRYPGGGFMSMSDMYLVVDALEDAIAAEDAGTWPTSFLEKWK